MDEMPYFLLGYKKGLEDSSGSGGLFDSIKQLIPEITVVVGDEWKVEICYPDDMSINELNYGYVNQSGFVKHYSHKPVLRVLYNDDILFAVYDTSVEKRTVYTEQDAGQYKYITDYFYSGFTAGNIVFYNSSLMINVSFKETQRKTTFENGAVIGEKESDSDKDCTYYIHNQVNSSVLLSDLSWDDALTALNDFCTVCESVYGTA